MVVSLYCPVLYGNSVFGAVVFHQGTWLVSSSVPVPSCRQQCRAEEGGWRSSITPLIMRQHGSGCAAMATILH